VVFVSTTPLADYAQILSLSKVSSHAILIDIQQELTPQD